MVTRQSPSEGAPSVNTSAPPNISMQGVRRELWSATDSDPDFERVWGDRHDAAAPSQPHADETGGGALHHVPETLRPGAASKNPTYDHNEENPWDDPSRDMTAAPALHEPSVKLHEVPNALRPGPARSETNPFKRKPLQAVPTGQGSVPQFAMPTEPPPPPPTDSFSQLQIAEPEHSNNPWQPALDEKKSFDTAPPAPPSLSDQGSANNIWDSGVPSRQPSTGPASNSSAVLSVQSTGESQPWDDAPPKPSLPALPEKSPEAENFLHDQHAWDDMASSSKGKEPAVLQSQMPSTTGEGWNLIDHEPVPEPVPGNLSRRDTWENSVDGDEEEPKAAEVPAPEQAPALPPRSSNDGPPAQPPRPQSPSAANKSETYQIKNINWYDAKAAKNPRKSPILVQNANGPCPLLALVNALTLTTPAEQTASNLVETLRSREQISLNFLLEAVIDELMSSRHTNSEVSLPDMSELYSFLRGLHTGMNVNPRFVPTPEAVTAHKRSSLGHIHPSERVDSVPGTFEETRDMKLYATFTIPLIHGWLPTREDPVYEAFSRQASSYDDAQSLLFREEELEFKFSSTPAGLTEQEQQLYQDIMTIKSFLSTSATQLTTWGLDVVTKSIQPGNVSILFRNDHFSTLYRHPQTHQLFTLVTDAGYFSHDEIVWESLVDVRGERAEFLSGDFRLVSGPGHQQRSEPVPGAWYDEAESSNNANGSGWQTVQSRRSPNNGQSQPSPETPTSPLHEQEDRDLALALQLQEEEEERHRAEQAARRRESQLSEQFIEQQGREGNRGGPRTRGASVSRGGGNPVTPARTTSASQPVNVPVGGGSQARGGRPVQQVRSLIPPVSTTTRPADDTVDAPPSYEQASKATPYVPPAGHPSHPESSPDAATSRRRTTLTGQSNAGPSTPNRVRPGPPPVAAGNGMAQGNGGKDRDCVAM